MCRALMPPASFRGSSKEHHQILIELFFSLWRNNYRKNLITVSIEIDTVEAAKRCSNLILPATSFLAEILPSHAS